MHTILTYALEAKVWHNYGCNIVQTHLGRASSILSIAPPLYRHKHFPNKVWQNYVCICYHLNNANFAGLSFLDGTPGTCLIKNISFRPYIQFVIIHYLKLKTQELLCNQSQKISCLIDTTWMVWSHLNINTLQIVVWQIACNKPQINSGSLDGANQKTNFVRC